MFGNNNNGIGAYMPVQPAYGGGYGNGGLFGNGGDIWALLFVLALLGGNWGGFGGFGWGGMSFADGRGGNSNGMSYGNSYGYSYADNRMPNMGNSYRGGYSRTDRIDAAVDSVNGAMADLPVDLQRDAQTFLNRMQQARMNAR